MTRLEIEARSRRCTEAQQGFATQRSAKGRVRGDGRSPFAACRVALPLVAGLASRRWVITTKGQQWFEVAIATAVTLFGPTSGAPPATVVGVSIEVPLMPVLVRLSLHTRHWLGAPPAAAPRERL